MSLTQLTHDALALPLEDRLVLTQKLWASLPPDVEPELLIDEEELAEVMRRDAEMEENPQACISELDFREEVAKIRESFRCE